MRVPSIVGATSAIVLAAALGCGPANVQPENSAFGECEIRWPVEQSPDTITIALFDAVDARNAPEWTNDAERLVFNQLYETLLGTECENGKRRLGLAEKLSVGSHKAVLTLREGARFWDGTPVTSHDVVDCLGKLLDSGSPIDSVVAINDREVVVHAKHAGIDWGLLSSPSFCVVRSTGSVWPMGTGPHRIAEQPGDDTAVLIAPAVAPGLPSLRFVDRRGIDPRDIIDASTGPAIDLLVVLGSNDLISYAQTDRFKAMLFPAPTRAYVLIAPGRARVLQRGGVLPRLPQGFSKRLAVAVRDADPLAIEDQLWWDADVHRGPTAVSMGSNPTKRRVVFDAADATARDLAERITSLAATETTTDDAVALAASIPGIVDHAQPLLAFGARDREFAECLSRGADVAYVLAVPFDTPDPIGVSAHLRHSMPWLGASLADCLLPLVSTSELAIVMNHRIGVASDRFGNVFVVGPTTLVSP